MPQIEIRNNLAKLRVMRGFGATQLAAEVGVSRQTIYAMEAGSYVPNTAVSLKLARVFEVQVDEIFQIANKKDRSTKIAEAIFLGGLEATQPRNSLRLCNVNGQVIAVPPDLGGWGLAPADAVLLAPILDGKRKVNARIEVFGDRWNNPALILIAGCDPSAPILAHALVRQGYELVISYHNSSRSLDFLKQKLVHIAGTHLTEEITGRTDLLAITNMYPRNSVAVFSYTVWQEGLVVTRGNPKKITGIRDLLRQDVKIMNREPGSGCRKLLDDQLASHGIACEKVRGYDRITLGHLPAAQRVHLGEADCCIGLQAGARALGLDFIELNRKPYHLVIRRKDLELTPVKTLLETLGKSSFRREMEACTGYDMRTAGDRLV
jgi:molybdate-binding protein/DNA-binding XRE family transcriptional regulator